MADQKNGKTWYSDEEKRAALELYADLGPREASRRLGINIGTLKAWAARAGVRAIWREKYETGPETGRETEDETGPETASSEEADAESDEERFRRAVERARQRTAMLLELRHEAGHASAVTAQEKRALIREMMLDQTADALARMNEPHIEFVGKDGDQVTYPKAPASAFGTYAASVATLIKTYRLEMGESTSKPENHVDLRKRVEALAAKEGLDLDEVQAEAERVLAEARENATDEAAT